VTESSDETASVVGQEVGRVAGTVDSTPLKFHVALNEDSYLQLDDVVVTWRNVPGYGEVSTTSSS